MNRTHGHCSSKHSPTYICWATMKQRVKRDPLYKELRVCERWQTFSNFLEDMGERPEGMTLDRIENDKGYCPENCRWATPKQQANNRSTNVLIEYNGVKQGLMEWAENLGISYLCLEWRLKNGWTIEKAFTTPSRSHIQTYEYNGETLTIDQWAKKLGFHVNTLKGRLSRGWTIEAAFTTPSSKHNRFKH